MSLDYLPGTASLLEELDKRLMVLLRDGRTLIGYLRYFLLTLIIWDIRWAMEPDTDSMGRLATAKIVSKLYRHLLISKFLSTEYPRLYNYWLELDRQIIFVSSWGCFVSFLFVFNLICSHSIQIRTSIISFISPRSAFSTSGHGFFRFLYIF